MANEKLSHYRLYTLLILGKIGGCERRDNRVFLHLPTAARYLGTSTKRLKEYVVEGVECAIFYDLTKRHKIWSLSLALPPDFNLVKKD